MNRSKLFRWVDEVDRADELTEALGVQRVVIASDFSDDKIREMQAEDPDLGPVMDWITDGHSPSPDVVIQHSLESRNL